MDFNAQSLRQYIQQQGLKRADVATPFWPEIDGHVALQDMPSDQLIKINANPLVKDDQGKFDVARMMACVICYSLIVKDTSELIFPISLTDFANRDIVVGLGGSVLTPVFKQAQEFFGMGDKDAVEAAKQAFLANLNGESGTASQPPLAQQ